MGVLRLQLEDLGMRLGAGQGGSGMRSPGSDFPSAQVAAHFRLSSCIRHDSCIALPFRRHGSVRTF